MVYLILVPSIEWRLKNPNWAKNAGKESEGGRKGCRLVLLGCTKSWRRGGQSLRGWWMDIRVYAVVRKNGRLATACRFVVGNGRDKMEENSIHVIPVMAGYSEVS
jgi:hypothetical protein